MLATRKEKGCIFWYRYRKMSCVTLNIENEIADAIAAPIIPQRDTKSTLRINDTMEETTTIVASVFCLPHIISRVPDEPIKRFMS